MDLLTLASPSYGTFEHVIIIANIITYACRMPLLYNSINGGRFLCALFFLCLTLAGISSLVSILEIAVHALNDFGSE